MDVIDAEYTTLLSTLRSTDSFRKGLSAHRNFLSALARLSMIDNSIVQDGIERVIQVCLRYLAVSQVMDQVADEEGDEAIPLEEVEALRKDFFAQVSYLFQIMRKVESRGFIFRLDFNGFMSELCATISK